MTRSYENTVYDCKNLLGRKFDDEEIQRTIKLWPFKVFKDTKSYRPLIQVNFLNEKQSFYSEEIIAMLLSRMRQISENYLFEELTDTIITVPSYFNESQRQ